MIVKSLFKKKLSASMLHVVAVFNVFVIAQTLEHCLSVVEIAIIQVR